MKNCKNKNIQNLAAPMGDDKALLKFLKQTKDGKYAQIEKSSLNYTRIEQETEHYDINEDEYYYSIT